MEADTNRCLIQSTWVQSLDKFPDSGGSIKLHMNRATSISSITYQDDDDVEQTLDSGEYTLDTGRNEVVCTNDTDGWPDTWTTINGRDIIHITFLAGATDQSTLPRLFKQAILLEVGRYYYDPAQENGVNTNDGRSYENLVKKLMRSTYP